MPRRLLHCALLGLILVAAPLGCQPAAPPLSAWVADDMVALTDRTAATSNLDVFDPRGREIRLFAAGNETVSFQLVLDAGDEAISNIRLELEDLFTNRKDRIPAQSIRAYRMLPVPVTEYPAWYLRLADAPATPAAFYDALIPLDAPKQGQPYWLGPHQRLAVWVDIRVPRSAAAGDYSGRLHVAAWRHARWTAPVALKVYDFVLPDARPLAVVGGFGHDEVFGTMLSRQGRPYTPIRLDRTQPLVREGLTMLRQMMRLAHEHRVDLFDRDLHPLLKRGGDGQVLLDWSDYDAIVQPYFDGSAFDDRIGCAAWPMPFSQDWPSSEPYGGTATAAYASQASAVLAACMAHFTAMPEAHGRVFYWPYRGPVNEAGYDRHAELAKLCRELDPRTPILSQLPASPPEPTGWRAPASFASLTDIHAPRGEWVDATGAATMKRQDHPLYGIWLAPGMPPYMPSLGVLSTPADARALPWLAMKYGCSGLLIDEVLHWPDPRAGGDVLATAGAEARLFYPGKPWGLNDVLPSVRLKRLRRGLEDLSYLWLLQLREHDPVARSMLDAMVHYAGLAATEDHYLDPRLDGWAQDGRLWQQARAVLARECQAAVHGDEAAGDGATALHVAWRAFHDSARAVRLETAVARPTLGIDGLFHLDVSFDLYNECPEAASVQIASPTLPQGWSFTGADAAAATLPPGGRDTLRLQMQGSQFFTAGSGKMVLPFVLTVPQRPDRTLAVTVAALRGVVVKQPPVIDGKLNEWPVLETNTGRDFRLLGRRGLGLSGLGGRGLAARQTSVYVACDDGNLYLAIRAQEPNPAGVVVKPSNVVHYEQLLACGEDLVEVILDPGQGAQQPSDLYHLIVKPNAAVIAHRGIPSDPPLGPVRAWAAGATAAVGATADGWTVELAIPRSAFGAAGQQPAWGLNVARFATQGAEASSWAESPRDYYKPHGLGIMYLPAAKESQDAGRQNSKELP